MKKVLLGLLGAGIQASSSPSLYEREAAAQGIHCFYQLIDLKAQKLGIDAIPELLTAAERMGFAGLNITHPCKQVVLPLLTDISQEAQEIGAINGIVFRDGKRIGFNTDWIGFFNSFKHGLPKVRLKRVVQIGAGGAGAATAYALLKLGAEHISLIDKDAAKCDSLAADLNSMVGGKRVSRASGLEVELQHSDGILNASPVGMYGFPGTAVPTEFLSSHQWVADIVYFPRETELLRLARAAGCRTLDGTGMVVHQAIAAYERFFGVPPDVDRMFGYFEGYDERGR